MTTIALTLHVPSRLADSFNPPPAGITIKEKKQIIYFDAEGLSDLSLVIELLRGVALPLLAMWLYDTFVKKEAKTKGTELKIRETVYRVSTKEQIVEVLEREVEKRTEEES